MVFYILVRDIGFFIKVKKIVYLIIILKFLGFELDILKFEVRLIVD